MTYFVHDPASDQRLADYDTASADDIEAALAGADATHREWSARTVAERAALIGEVARLHRERADDLAALINTEMGKPVDEARGEVEFSADIYQYYADRAEDLLADEHVELLEGEGSAVVRRSSLGPLLGIMPWNFPSYQVSRFAAPNLVAGNTIVLKHAPQCPSSAAAIAQIFADAGLPDGAYTNVYATNDQVAEMIADRRVRGVSLTGSERAGAAVAEVAGRHLKKVVLELGGSDPFIVLGTDDLEAVVDAAVEARVDNNGQACNAAKRFIVIDALYDQFVELASRQLLARDPAPLSSRDAAEKLDEQLEKAVGDGARLVLEGSRDGTFFPAGLLLDVHPDHEVYGEELFGPVAMVFRVGDEEEAVRLANDTPYGLGSYVFTQDPAQAERVADRLDVGMVFVNGVGAEGAELQFGGTKRSGFGRELGRAGIQEFVNSKLIRTVA